MPKWFCTDTACPLLISPFTTRLWLYPSTIARMPTTAFLIENGKPINSGPLVSASAAEIFAVSVNFSFLTACCNLSMARLIPLAATLRSPIAMSFNSAHISGKPRLLVNTLLSASINGLPDCFGAALVTIGCASAAGVLSVAASFPSGPLTSCSTCASWLSILVASTSPSLVVCRSLLSDI